jgi:hypothetical protein
MSQQPDKSKQQESVKAKKLDRKFDEGKEIVSHLDLTKMKRPRKKQRSKK